MNNTTSFPTILLIDDDDIEAEGIQRAFRKSSIKSSIFRARHGIEALELLRSSKIEQPYIILLDINMPMMNGIEFLKEIRMDKHLSTSIVFILTTSNNQNDIASAYQEQVAGYLVKSKLDSQFTSLIELLTHYSKVIEFPPSNTSVTNNVFKDKK